MFKKFFSKLISKQSREEGELFNSSVFVIFKTLQHFPMKSVSNHVRTKGVVFYLPFFKYGKFTRLEDFALVSGWQVARIRISYETPLGRPAFWAKYAVWSPLSSGTYKE